MITLLRSVSCRSRVRSVAHSKFCAPRHSFPPIRRAMADASTKEPASGSEKKHFYAPDTSSDGRAPQFTSGQLTRHELGGDPLEQFSAWYAAASGHGGIATPYAACLSTAALPSGRVSSRFVYLKEVDARGFVVYSNWGTSRKASDLATNPHASLAFWWEPLQRQVRVDGTVQRLSTPDSQLYYTTRARGSKIGAWASRQSQVLEPQTTTKAKITETTETTAMPVVQDGNGNDMTKDDGRAQLDNWVAEQEARFHDTPDADIPCPPFWGGMRLVPDRIEFWQGRDSRLHDRLVYVRRGGPEDEDGDEESSTEEKSQRQETNESEGKPTWKIQRLSP